MQVRGVDRIDANAIKKDYFNKDLPPIRNYKRYKVLRNLNN